MSIWQIKKVVKTFELLSFWTYELLIVSPAAGGVARASLREIKR
jgi:hypothetical protein